jgi:hypothetical protein
MVCLMLTKLLKLIAVEAKDAKDNGLHVVMYKTKGGNEDRHTSATMPEVVHPNPGEGQVLTSEPSCSSLRVTCMMALQFHTHQRWREA